MKTEEEIELEVHLILHKMMQEFSEECKKIENKLSVIQKRMLGLDDALIKNKWINGKQNIFLEHKLVEILRENIKLKEKIKALQNMGFEAMFPEE